MSARIEENGKFFRMRRGKKVEIPAVWVGEVAHPQSIRNRPSKKIHKLRKIEKYGSDYNNRRTKRLEEMQGT